MIKKYSDFIFENLNRSKSILNSKMADYEKIKNFLTKNNSIGYMGKFTEFLFNGVPYKEIMDLYEQIDDLKKKNIRINVDEYDKYESILDDIAQKVIIYKYKKIYNQFPKEQKELLGKSDQDDINLISKLYDVDSEAFIRKVSRHKNYSDIRNSIRRFLSGKSQSFDKESVKKLLSEDMLLVFENENILVLKTRTHSAIKSIGSDTSWCIVASESTFKRYTEKGSTQYVIIDYTKDVYDIDFKIGFTLDTNNKITYAHDVLDTSVKEKCREVLNNNGVLLNEINIVPKVDTSILNNMTPLKQIEDATDGNMSDDETFRKILSILCYKVSRSGRSGGFEAKALIKKIFNKKILLDGKEIDISQFDSYKKELGNVYEDIKKVLVDKFILICDMIPSNIFAYPGQILNHYKNWNVKLTDDPYNYIISIQREKNLATAMLYYAKNSKKTIGNEIVGLYCKKILGEQIDINHVKILIDSLEKEYHRYTYYNLFDIKYHFDIKHAGHVEEKNILDKEITLVDQSYYNITQTLRVIESLPITLSYSIEYILSEIPKCYRLLNGKIVQMKSNSDDILPQIISPIIDKLSMTGRRCSIEDGVIPLTYNIDIKSKSSSYNRFKSREVKIIINNE